ncbi:MAG: Asp/Glu/hydantoin racemase [Alphaproteobacteria bacterium]|nr:Asp/Glu/hydantoin racemase [Alphaproteobacteria bacterium]MCB9928816.1 Asp/Glu/hydantoin racemase [Alphaproteobacteria bacterium]
MLTPSSNTVLEPVVAAMLRDAPGVSAHFSRFRVLQISMGADSQSQFDPEPMLAAADLLADARVHAICWNGTSAGWLGFEQDERLCAAITARTGIPAQSAVLGFNALFAERGLKRLGLVSPYIADVQRRIIANYAAIGIETVADERLGIAENFAFAAVTEDTIAALCRRVAEARPDGIAIYCTNVDGAALAPRLERELGIPVYDSGAVALWAGLRAAGASLAPFARWGRLFGAA